MSFHCYTKYVNNNINYYLATRRFNDEIVKSWNKYKIKAPEIVSLDSILLDLVEIEEDEALNYNSIPNYQIVATVKIPSLSIKKYLSQNSFELCGYDLVDNDNIISVITDCGAIYSETINYDQLNEFGLLSNYEESLFFQKLLLERYPNETHADCVIIEIWRKL